MSDTFGRFELSLYERAQNGNCCVIMQIRGGSAQEFHCEPEDLRDLRYVVEKALRALEQHE